MSKTNLVNLEGRHPIIKTRVWWQERVISSEMCDLLLNEMDWSKAHEGGILRKGETQHNHDRRKTNLLFLDTLSPIGCIMQCYIGVANVQSNWNFATSFIEPVQVGQYNVGSHYDWHCDTYNPDEFGNQRKLSSVLILSNPEDYEGGILELKDLDDPIPKLSKGSIIVFPSVLPHRVTEVTSGMRYSAVAWAVGPAFK